MAKAVLKAASYYLANTPDMIMNNGTTQTTERQVNPDSEYLKKAPEHIRPFDEVVNYLPNQVYIGNERYEKLEEVGKPWTDKDKYLDGASRWGEKGEIMPQSEFTAMIKIADEFETVHITPEFAERAKKELSEHPILSKREDLIARIGDGESLESIEKRIADKGEELTVDGEIVGVVSRAHDVDPNLNAHTMLENLAAKASGVMAGLNLIANNDINPEDVNYVIECSEEACGDMNQRGGGNFAKAIAEQCGFVNATGVDMRSFCAAPSHTLIAAASHVAAGTSANVVIIAGGATAKLAMNGKDHVKKDLPLIEDCVAGFAALVTEDDGVSPIIRNDNIGKHRIATGSAPQAVMGALVTDPLEKVGLTVKDVDAYASEMQNPDITEPAGSGNVPEANMKMIGALGVMKGHLERTEMPDFVANAGPMGYAPTQGHIPSGAPYFGFAIDDLTTGDFNRVMIIGKGSLFLGRLTNLFDGMSVMLERNTGQFLNEGGAEGSSDKEAVKEAVAEAMREFASSLIEG